LVEQSKCELQALKSSEILHPIYSKQINGMSNLKKNAYMLTERSQNT
jgi:hypothetical protein